MTQLLANAHPQHHESAAAEPPTETPEPAASALVAGVDPNRIGRRYWSIRRLSAPLRRHWLDLDVQGIDNVAPDGGVILAANHRSFLDAPALMYALDRPVHFLGKAEYLDHGLSRWLFPAAGMIPVDRSGRGVAASLGVAIDRLRSGGVVGIFPEGTRTRDGDLHDGHPGVAHLALKARVPIVPVGIVGTDHCQPPGARLPRSGTSATIRFGAPVDLGPWAGRRPTRGTKHEITEAVMASIASLSGQTRSCDRIDAPAAYAA